MSVRISTLIQHIRWAPNLKRLWFYYMKMTPQKVMGAGKRSLIEHISWAPNLKRLWLHYVKMTPEKMNDLSSGQGEQKKIQKKNREKRKEKGKEVFFFSGAPGRGRRSVQWPGDKYLTEPKCNGPARQRLRRVHQYAKIAQESNLAPKRSPPNGAPEQPECKDCYKVTGPTM